MFPVDTGLLASILAPVILVSFLILVKTRQEKSNRKIPKAPKSPIANSRTKSLPRNAQTIHKSEEETKQSKCPQYFGYLHNSARPHPLFKTNPEGSFFPEECYNCPKLIECVYSSTIVHHVYGTESEKT